MNGSERRQYPRLPYGAWVETEDDEQGLRFYPSINLSAGGLLLRAPDVPPPLGRRVRLRLVVENEARVMTVQGEVVRHDHDRTFAVRFANLDTARQAFLQDLVDEVAAGQGDKGAK